MMSKSPEKTSTYATNPHSPIQAYSHQVLCFSWFSESNDNDPLVTFLTYITELNVLENL